MNQKRTGKRTLFLWSGVAVALIGSLLLIHFGIQVFGDFMPGVGEVASFMIDAKALPDLPAANQNEIEAAICPSCRISLGCEGIRSLGLFSLLFLSLLICVAIFEISRRLSEKK